MKKMCNPLYRHVYDTIFISIRQKILDNFGTEFQSQHLLTLTFMPANVLGTVLGNMKAVKRYRALFLNSENCEQALVRTLKKH